MRETHIHFSQDFKSVPDASHCQRGNHKTNSSDDDQIEFFGFDRVMKIQISWFPLVQMRRDFISLMWCGVVRTIADKGKKILEVLSQLFFERN